MVKIKSLPFIWKIGRVLKLHLGKDKFSPVAELKPKDGLLVRHLHHIAPLPINDHQDQDQ